MLVDRNCHITNAKELAEELSESGLNASTYPTFTLALSSCKYDWDNYRREVAKELLERCIIIKKAWKGEGERK